jgi:transcriptional regulator with XRE-family HTH domain
MRVRIHPGPQKWYCGAFGVVHARTGCVAHSRHSIRNLAQPGDARRRPQAFEAGFAQEYARDMQIGQKLRELREVQGLTQADIGKQTGLFPSYMSRVESGYIVPTIETLEKWTRALRIPLYELFYEGEQTREAPAKPRPADQKLWGNSRKQAVLLDHLRQSLSRMRPADREALMLLAGKMAARQESSE